MLSISKIGIFGIFQTNLATRTKFKLKIIYMVNQALPLNKYFLSVVSIWSGCGIQFNIFFHFGSCFALKHLDSCSVEYYPMQFSHTDNSGEVNHRGDILKSKTIFD